MDVPLAQLFPRINGTKMFQIVASEIPVFADGRLMGEFRSSNSRVVLLFVVEDFLNIYKHSQGQVMRAT